MSADLFNPRLQGARCVSCQREWTPKEIPFTCPDCGPLLGTIDFIYDFHKNKPHSPAAVFHRDLWDWKDFLPVAPPESVRLLPVGATPLVSAEILAREIGVRRVWLKDDRLNPSGSLKDRASTVGLAHAIGINAEVVAAASTGNAASSLATLAAASGVKAVLFVPESAPEAKLAQLLLHGARVIRIKSTYDDAFDICAKVCQKRGWYSRNTATNPFLTEGKKTVILESVHQIGEVPDVVFVPVGDGCILGAVHKGLCDLQAAGFIERMPRLIGVQAKSAAPLVNAKDGTFPIQEEDVKTFADSIRVGLPRDQVKAMRAVKETGGAWVAVSDDAIRDAMILLAQKSGVFAEPAGAAALAGLIEAKQKGLIQEEESALVLITGHGLKDIKGTLTAAPHTPDAVAPTMEAVEKVISFLVVE
ncbi:threonine synthase [bacterium]|nr:threonine synthase [bacterium]MBU1936896.1 threonine synthase [bacterium]